MGYILWNTVVFLVAAADSLVIQFHRHEILAGFSNAVFLLFVAIFEIMEAFHHIAKPPETHGYAIRDVLVCVVVLS